MTKKQKSAKRAFLSSFLSFVLCFTMFAGTTYAWYNDSVTSGRNTIVSGSLEMAIQYYTGPTDNTADFTDDDNWTDITSETKIFPEIDNKLTFEPGAVRVAYVRVKNGGDLAFKYNLVAVAENEKAGESQTGAAILLSNILKFGKAKDLDEPFATREAAISAVSANATTIANATLSDGGAHLAKGATSGVIALVIYLPSNTGNEANPKPNAKPEISFGLNAVATQFTVENDSFSNTYDALSEFPGQAVAGATYDADAETTITAGPATATIPAATVLNVVDDTDLVLTVEQVNPSVANITINEGDNAIAYDVSLTDGSGAAVTATTGGIKVVLDIGVVDLQSFYHNSTPLTLGNSADTLGVDEYYYDVGTGILTFVTASFSPFTAVYRFSGGLGTEQYPYLLAGRDDLENVGKYYYQNSYYFKVKDGVSSIDCSNWNTIEYFGGTLDGNGVALTGLDQPFIYYIWDGLSGSTATIKNFDITCNMHYSDDRGAIVTYSGVKNTVFENVNIHGVVESSLGCSPYVGYGAYGYNYYYFNNCVSDVALIATGGAASGFVNHPSYSTAEGSNPTINAKIFVTDSIYKGRMSAIGATEKNYNFKYFVVNSNGLAVTTKYSDEFIAANGNPVGKLYGTPKSYTENDDGSITFNAGNYGSQLVDYYRPSDTDNMKATLAALTVAVPAKGDAFTFAKVSGGERAVITLEIGANDETGHGNYVGTYEIEEIDISGLANGANVTTSTIKNFNVVVIPANNNPSNKTTGAEGANYYVISNRNGSTYGSAVVRVTQYDAYGNVIGTKSISIKA